MNFRDLYEKSVFLIFLLSQPAHAWEDDVVLTFINQTNPLILAHKNVTQAYSKPDTVNWVLQNSALVARLGAGGTDFSQAPYTAYGGLQLNIPLSSVAQDRERALKGVAEQREITDIQNTLIIDITNLRSLESELAASTVRRDFLKEKAAWQKERIAKGYSSELDQLWSIGANLNQEDALVAKLNIQIKTQRYKIAKYAGSKWRILLAYLEDKTKTLGDENG